MTLLTDQIRLIGAGGHAKVVYEVAQQSGLDTCFLVEVKYLESDSFMGGELRGLEPELAQAGLYFHCAVGNHADRTRLFEKAVSAGWLPLSVIAPSAVISASSLIAPGVFAGTACVINASTRVGQNCIVNTGAIIEHDCVIGDHSNISPHATLCGGVRVGAHTDIGAGATVLPKVSIGSGCVVAAGAVVVHDVDDGMVVRGVPAR